MFRVWRSGALYATHARSRTTTALALDFDSAVAVARFVDSQGGGCVGGDGPCFVCQGRLEVDLVLRLSTEDGALDETLPITLSTGTVETASFTAELDAADVVGAYFEAITPNDGYSISGLHVEAHYSAPFSGAMTR